MEQMRKDVKRLIEDPVLRSEMGKRARNYAHQEFNIENNIRVLEKFFSSIL